MEPPPDPTPKPATQRLNTALSGGSRLLQGAMERPKTALLTVAGLFVGVLILSNFDVRRDVELFDWELIRLSFSSVFLLGAIAGAGVMWALRRKL
ncbi:MAG: hypothetical protein HYY13_10180 [Nitrospirae bacterium]|nr:hypothetical protein [Nitrospirota bacterium]